MMFKTKIAIVVVSVCGWFSMGCTGCAQTEPPMMSDDSCITEATRCVSNTYERCDNEQWVVEQVCEQTCANDRGCIGGLSSECDLTTQHIYLISSGGEMLQFDPSESVPGIDRLDLNLDNCFGAPFSMSVDRTGRAWILSQLDGEIYWVDLKTGECTDSNYQQSNMFSDRFGMGFASDANDPTREYLYVASVSGSISQSFGAIDPETGQLHVRGDLTHTGLELTGTSEGRLFAYSPQNGLVLELNTNQGEELQRWSVPQLSFPTAWAFAHWGGFLYMFVTDGGNKIFRLDPETGQTEMLEENGEYSIVGAGVSTCAPVVIN